MAFPTAYTEKTLAEYMASVLGHVATALGWSVGADDAGDYAEAVYDALFAYGTDDIATVSGLANIRKLRILARRAVWRLAGSSLAADYDFDADGGQYSRSQVYEHAQAELARAETDAAPYDEDGTYRVTSQVVGYADDPYQPPEEDE